MERLLFLCLCAVAAQAQSSFGLGNGFFGGSSQYTQPSCPGLIIPLYPCYAVSEAPSFVACNSTSNKCYCKPGFSGNATPANKCRCDAPKQVYFQLGSSEPLNSDSLADALASANILPPEWGVVAVRCVDLLGFEAAEAKNEKHKKSVLKFFNNTIFPTPQIILASQGAVLADILSPTVRSRISPAGSFNGFEGVVEYFYGFVATPGNIVTGVDIKSIAATGNTVACKANIKLVNQNANVSGGFPPANFNLSIFSFFTFDNNDKISSIDVSVPNLGKLLDAPIPALLQGKIQLACQILTLPSAFSTNLTGTCGWMDPFQTGKINNGTAQFLGCVGFMNSITYGSYNRMNANNFVCRFLHALLTPYGPAAHCPHVTPSGGGACIEFTYESFFQEEY